MSGECLSEEEERIHQIAKIAAQETVHETFTTLGINTNKPYEIQKDIAYLRNLRESSEDLQRVIRRSGIGVAITAIAVALWIGIKEVVTRGH